MENRRKVLFTYGMSSDAMIIITNAPSQAIEQWCKHYNAQIENGGHFELFDTLKAQYYVKLLHDSEINDREDIEIIGYDEQYNLNNY
jgi:hypothetical protein